VPAWLNCPDITLFDHEALVVEAEERHAGEGLDRVIARGDRRPPLDRRPLPGDDGPTEATLGGPLVGERPRDVLGRAPVRPERM
jgi:hypothetical protein